MGAEKLNFASLDKSYGHDIGYSKVTGVCIFEH